MKNKSIWKAFVSILLFVLPSCDFGSNQSKEETIPSIDRKAQYHGIDVSNHQGKIDWSTVAKDKAIKFAYIKATEGATHIDRRYSTNISEARRNNILVGSYHYFRMTSSAHAQFDLIRKTIIKDKQDLVPMIDVETTDKKSVKETQDSLRVLLHLVEKHYGVRPMIYGTNRSFNEICGRNFKQYNAYIGRYGKNAPILKGDAKYHYYIWQYSESGKVAGINKGVDLWRFHPNADVKSILMNSTLQKSVENSIMTIEERDGLRIYYPAYNKIDLVCGVMPSPADNSVLMSCEAAFTGELLKDFRHSNIAGNHTSGGTYFRGYSCKANTGCFAWYGDTKEWNFAMNDYNKYVVLASQRSGMAFGQVMVIYNYHLQSKMPQKSTSVNYYRVLAELNGKLCIIDGKHTMKFKDFCDALVAIGTKHAIYLDMGSGWNYSFYRDNTNKVHFIHNRKIPYTTNWITFYK